MGYAEELAKLQEEQRKRNAELEANAKQLESQLNANADALKQAQTENEAAMLAAQQRQQQDFASVALQYKRDYDAALAEDEALRRQEDRRSIWTAATEAVANINNLIGVGSLGASNQTYHSYAKDWMDRADAERRYRRNRLDNIRDRQRIMQQQLAQLRGAQAQQYIAMRGQNAGQRYNADMQIANALGGARDRIAAQRANDAASIANIAISQGNADRQFEEQKRARQAQEAARREQLEETQRYHDATIAANMAKQGYSPDGNGGWKYTGKHGGGSGGSTFSYDARIDGQNVRLDMKKETFDQAVMDGREELRQDVAKMLGVQTWDDVKSKVVGKDKKGRESAKAYGDLRGIISELSGDGMVTNDDVVASFINDHRGELNNFNKHVQRVSQSALSNGYDESEEIEDETGGAAAFFGM